MSSKTAGPRLEPERRQQIVQGFQSVRVLVVGDVMLDQFIWGRVTRISPEAPVPIVEFVVSKNKYIETDCVH